MGRFGKVAEIASVVRFLLSPTRQVRLTGVGWQVDGGWINCEIPFE
jgi:NAD(P)-dependent dehydrogenase (short-subunit alcohol dehydrogenase family)